MKLRSGKETAARPCTLYKLAPETLKNIYKYYFQLDERVDVLTIRDTSLIAALRPCEDLYHGILAYSYEKHLMKLRPHLESHRERFLAMKPEVFALVKNLHIDLGTTESVQEIMIADPLFFTNALTKLLQHRHLQALGIALEFQHTPNSFTLPLLNHFLNPQYHGLRELFIDMPNRDTDSTVVYHGGYTNNEVVLMRGAANTISHVVRNARYNEPGLWWFRVHQQLFEGATPCRIHWVLYEKGRPAHGAKKPVRRWYE
ncbi:hypothetical protein HYFRA_00006312 [Hymenoscyphus fraxineus]|uniref:Uncharacterized protein n=1 Tax=Hymenoscyphus fraxineus TaxID=746836 RepID=A0A9N9L959_9HELO|nr:hypothetical protein HYFRA_00006312 [Hymenoscyphus fraxineus]